MYSEASYMSSTAHADKSDYVTEDAVVLVFSVFREMGA